MSIAPHVPPLPAAIRLAEHRSVLHRGHSARQLGLDPATAVAVDDLGPPLAAMLDELGDAVDPAELTARAVRRGADVTEAEALLRALLAAGAVVDAAGPLHRARARADSVVVVDGEGPLAVGVTLGLVRAGVGTVHLRTAGTVLAGDLGTGLAEADRGSPRLAAVAATARGLCPAAAIEAPPLRVVPDLVVLADSAAPDPSTVAALHVAGTAHLAVRLRDGTGLVGPLVLPGRTTCLNCMERHRQARDPGWPAAAEQLVGRRGAADPACTAATSALGTAQALAALDATSTAGAAPPVLDAVLELEPAAGTLLRRTWAAHPGCRCGAAGAHGRTCGWDPPRVGDMRDDPPSGENHEVGGSAGPLFRAAPPGSVVTNASEELT